MEGWREIAWVILGLASVTGLIWGLYDRYHDHYVTNSIYAAYGFLALQAWVFGLIVWAWCGTAPETSAMVWIRLNFQGGLAMVLTTLTFVTLWGVGREGLVTRITRVRTFRYGHGHTQTIGEGGFFCGTLPDVQEGTILFIILLGCMAIGMIGWVIALLGLTIAGLLAPGTPEHNVPAAT